MKRQRQNAARLFPVYRTRQPGMGALFVGSERRQGGSDKDALDLVERDLVGAAVVEGFWCR